MYLYHGYATGNKGFYAVGTLVFFVLPYTVVMIFPVLFPLVNGKVHKAAIMDEISKFGNHHKVRTAAIVVSLFAMLALRE